MKLKERLQIATKVTVRAARLVFLPSSLETEKPSPEPEPLEDRLKLRIRGGPDATELAARNFYKARNELYDTWCGKGEPKKKQSAARCYISLK